jgi:hypothetical protein
MKKINLLMMTLVIAAFFISATGKAQEVKGKNFVNAGIGIGTYGFVGTGGLPITASFEHGFTDKISAGLTGGLVQRSYYSDWKYKYFVIGARGSYHFNEVLNVTNPKLDVYGGISLFYRGWSVKYKGNDLPGGTQKSSAGEVDFALHAAARYMFSEKVGGYAELGYGISPLQIGVSFKF